MSLTIEEKAEYQRLYDSCGMTLLYPGNYKYNKSDDTYQDTDDKHEWFNGSDVRRLKVLREKSLEENK